MKDLTKKEAVPEDDEKAEDMLLAFELLNKYKKDSKFIQKDIKSLKKKSDLIIRNDDPDEKSAPAKKPALDPILTQEERHRIIAEKREKRKQD